MMNLDPTALCLSFLFGAIGMGFFTYGKKQQEWLHLWVGVALMGLPYFITNALAMTLVCVAVAAVPFVVTRLQ